jgi:uncharacterized protein
MFLYKETVGGFKEDVDSGQMVPILEGWYKQVTGRRVSDSERRSWGNSLGYMERVVRRSQIDDSCGVLIEYIIPSTSNRIDFFVSGHDEQGNKNFIIVELKQWERAEATEKEGVVSTFLGGTIRDTSHPSYQAQSYKLFLRDFYEAVAQDELMAHSCAYLHNFEARSPEPLATGIYTELVEDTPIYFREDQEKLENFLKRFVGKGNGEQILYEIESGQIRPSKKLIDHVASMFEGNKEFVLLDEQKIAYETAKYVAKTAKTKSVVIIKGGPGTGKSVVSVNLLGGLLKSELNTVFVAPNASFRDVMVDRLAKHHARTRLRNLFKGSSAFMDVSPDTFDAIIVDEAHRLKNSQAYMYQGENQVEDVMKASKTSIFFIDDDQAIRPEDVGSVKEIKRVAEGLGAEVHELELVAQFRCSGAEGYINWLNDVLHIKQTANFDGWDQGSFDFKIFDDPNKMREAIKRKHDEGHKARILAGYAWKWTGAKEGNSDGQVEDVEIAEYDFRMPWNSRRVGTTWAIDPSGIDQAGCIHTSQGLEFDYVGVIIGPDLRFDPETMKYYTKWDEYKDTSGKKGLKDDPEKLNQFVRNIYKVLMTRGMKGCYVFVCDGKIRKFMRSRIGNKDA